MAVGKEYIAETETGDPIYYKQGGGLTTDKSNRRKGWGEAIANFTLGAGFDSVQDCERVGQRCWDNVLCVETRERLGSISTFRVGKHEPRIHGEDSDCAPGQRVVAGLPRQRDVPLHRYSNDANYLRTSRTNLVSLQTGGDTMFSIDTAEGLVTAVQSFGLRWKVYSPWGTTVFVGSKKDARLKVVAFIDDNQE